MSSKQAAATPLAEPGDDVVLDTNAVLDWLVFADARMAGWAGAIEAGRVRWLVCAPMRDELARTLGRAALSRWRPDAAAVLARWTRHAVGCPLPPAQTAGRLRCRDPDDQVFVDLALAQRAGWLVTHDRALLALARAASDVGLQIVAPAAA